MKHIWILVTGLILMMIATGCTTTTSISPVATPTPQIVYVTVTVPVTVLVTDQTPFTTQTTSDIRVIGNVYGIRSNQEIRFTIGLIPGASTIDLTKMKIICSGPIMTRTLTHSDIASEKVFTSKLNGVNVNSLNQNDQVEIAFKPPNYIPGTKINIELKPAVGTGLSFSKSFPSTLSGTDVLF